MPPVLILQHLSTDGPAYLGHWLRREGVAHVVMNTQAELKVAFEEYNSGTFIKHK